MDTISFSSPSPPPDVAIEVTQSDVYANVFVQIEERHNSELDMKYLVAVVTEVIILK